MKTEKFTPSYDILKERIEKLKAVVPEAFEDGKINFATLKEVLVSESIEDETQDTEHYSFTWPGKRQARRLVIKPPQGALAPANGEGINETESENIFIEGDNLEVLKLLQKSYAGRVNLIYIDPPYNTGNDFVYSDNFTQPLQDYLKLTKQVDGEGNPLVANTRSDGRYHTKWLNMMYPRLKLAKNLLHTNGVILVSLDDSEATNARKIMDEIFGESQFAGIFPWRSRTAKADVPFGISSDVEWVICYAMEGFMAGRTGERKYFKSADFEDRWRLSDLTKQTTKDERPNSYFPLINPKNGESFPANPNRTWSITKDTFPEYYEKGKIVFPGDYDFLKIKMPAFRVFESEDKKKALLKHGTEEIRMSVSTYLPEKSIGRTEHGSEEIRDLFDSQVFSFPKPTSLIRFFLENLGQKDSVVLDFFAGSGTTGHAVMAQNITDGGTRKYILIQLPEPLNPDNKNKKVASDYCDKLGKPRNLAELAKERLRRAHKRLDLSKKTAGQDYGFRVFKLQKSNFQEWNEYTGSDISELMELFSKQENTLASEWDEEALLTEIILQEGFPLSSSREKVVSVKENTVWKFTSHTCEHSLYICLDKSIKSKALESIPLTGKDIFICLDNAVRDEEKVKLSDKGLIKTI